jgi:serine/threonine protein kinase
VRWLSDAVLTHLCKVADWPDLTGTRYDLVEKIGQGGMGTVYLVRDRELDRPVALKVLNALPDDAQTRDRLVHEARIIARLEHPSIVPVHDSGVLPDGRFFYAMKWVRGKRLDEEAERPCMLTERLQLFQKVCDAVAFAHAHGIIHRDLKPQNIMIGEFGEVLIMDWGIATMVGDKNRHPGAVLGTPGYMAPEQARGDPALIDQRADVYALGAVLYFLLSGKPPVYKQPLARSGQTEPAALVSPRRMDRSVPRPLVAVCRMALASDLKKRYDGAAELAGDVADFLAGRRVRAYPERPVEAALRLGKKYRAVVALIVAYLLMRILLLLFVGP